MEILSEPVAQHNVTSMWGIFQGSGSGCSQAAYVPSLKIHFISDDELQDYFHFRSSNLRFFNNCLTQITHPDEMMGKIFILTNNVESQKLK